MAKDTEAGLFEKLMIDKLGPDIANRIPLDWMNPRVICIAESYSKFDVDTASPAIRALFARLQKRLLSLVERSCAIGRIISKFLLRANLQGNR